MIWHYFPIGMRFPVADFSEETKRACWKVALGAAFASDATQTGLYEACESYDPIAQSPVYICIVCYVGVKQSRAAGDKLHALDTLLTRLCLHRPFIQANDLENFGPYPILAEIDSQGTILPSETGASFIPTEKPIPMEPSEGHRILIATGSMRSDCNAESLSRALGIPAADHGFRVRRMTAADGGEGTVRTLVTETGGRYETVSCEDINGNRVGMLVGAIPGSAAVIEAADAAGAARVTDQTPSIERRSSFGVGMLIQKTLDLGFRKIWIGLGDSQTFDLGLGALSALGVRFTDAEGEAVVPCPETLEKIVGVDRSELDPRIAQTEMTLLYDDDTPLLGREGALKAYGVQTGATEAQADAWAREMIRLAAVLGGDVQTSGGACGGGLGFALASIGGRLQPGAETVLDRIDIGFALKEADFVIIGEGCFDKRSLRSEKAAAAITERLADADRPGCLFTGELGLDPDTLMRNHPNLKNVVKCPTGEAPFDDAVRCAFERSVLPLIGKDIANTGN